MASYTPGTYEGAARGYGGKLFVRVTVLEDRIEAVTVTQHKEYRGIAWGLNTTPIERYPELIVEYQSLNIPVVDGADLTCAAILDATAAALKAAGASKEDIAALRAAPAPKAPEYPDEVRTVDVVVCGAGAGGLAAAIEAKLAGADVVIVEKQGITGGVGNVFGSFFGVLINGTISSLVKTNGKLSSSWPNVVTALLLCFFIVLQAIFAKVKARRS